MSESEHLRGRALHSCQVPDRAPSCQKANTSRPFHPCPRPLSTQSARPAPPTLPRKRKLLPFRGSEGGAPGAAVDPERAPNLKPDAVDILDADGFSAERGRAGFAERICDAELASMF